MMRFVYTIFMAIFTYALWWMYPSWVDDIDDAEFIYAVGGIYLIVLYFFIGLPTIIITRINKKMRSLDRIKHYLISMVAGTLVFIWFFSKIAESDFPLILNFVVPYSLLGGLFGGFLFYAPIEIIRIFKIRKSYNVK